jgi:uncharacterized membrane protein
MSIETGKSLAGIGSLLLVIGTFVPFLGIVGLILMMYGMKNLADIYGDQSIFKNALYALVFGIIGIAAAAFIVIGLIFGGSLLGVSFGAAGALSGGVIGFIAGIFVAVVVAFIFYVLMAVYFKRAFDTLANKTGVSMFKTAGLLLLIGAILTIVVVGLILIFVAWILLTVAFFSISSAPQPSVPQPAQPNPA